MQRAIILFSGGLDSTTCLALAKQNNDECHTLTFNYKQRHRAELQAAKRLSQEFGASSHHVFDIALEPFMQSALINHTIAVRHYKNGDDSIPNTYVPARNTIFLAYALGLAETLHADRIYIGTSSVDYSGYADCRPEFISAFQQVANLATTRATQGHPVKIETPLIHLSKAQTIALGKKLGVDYSRTISCYQANDQGQACGNCDSCGLRQKGFAEAGITDPTHYVQNVA